MAKTAAAAKKTITDFLRDATIGLNAQLGGIATRDSVILPLVDDNAWFSANLPAALIDEQQDAPIAYPHVLIYLRGSRNENIEKFRYFSGRHEVAVEIRVSVEGFPQVAAMEDMLDRYVEAALNVLQSTARNWGAQPVQYGGRHTVAYEPVQDGGLNLVQSAIIVPVLEQHTS